MVISREEIKSHWDNRCQLYGMNSVGVIGSDTATQKEQYDKTIKFLEDKIKRNVTVVDYGCGVGKLSHLFDQKKYTGVDISSEMVDLARKNNPEYTYEVLGKVPKATMFFSANVLQHNEDSFVKELKLKDKFKHIFIYELFGSEKGREYLRPRTVEEYEKLIDLDCKQSWKTGSHCLMYFDSTNRKK